MSKDIVNSEKIIISCKNCIHVKTCEAKHYLDSVMDNFASYNFIQFKFDKYQMLAQSCSEFQSLSDVFLSHKPEFIEATLKPIELKDSRTPFSQNFEHGVNAFSTDNYVNAIPFFQDAVNENPNYSVYWDYLGLAYCHTGDYEKSLESFTKVTDLNPNNTTGWNHRGIVLWYLKKYEDAIKCYDKAIEMVPNDLTAWFYKGHALSNLGEYYDAIKCYDKGIEIDPKDADYWFYKGITFTKLEKYEDAIQCYDKATEYDPKYLNAWDKKGNTFVKLEKYEDAIKCYDKAIEIDPKYAITWFYKGVVFTKLEKYYDALTCFDKAIELNPDYKKRLEYHNTLSWLAIIHADANQETSIDYIKKLFEVMDGISKKLMIQNLQKNKKLTKHEEIKKLLEASKNTLDTS